MSAKKNPLQVGQGPATGGARGFPPTHLHYGPGGPEVKHLPNNFRELFAIRGNGGSPNRGYISPTNFGRAEKASALSHQAATAKSSPSANGAATICTATGSPSVATPQGIEATGKPE